MDELKSEEKRNETPTEGRRRGRPRKHAERVGFEKPFRSEAQRRADEKYHKKGVLNQRENFGNIAARYRKDEFFELSEVLKSSEIKTADIIRAAAWLIKTETAQTVETFRKAADAWTAARSTAGAPTEKSEEPERVERSNDTEGAAGFVK